jgi:hypothetical protein
MTAARTRRCLIPTMTTATTTTRPSQVVDPRTVTTQKHVDGVVVADGVVVDAEDDLLVDSDERRRHISRVLRPNGAAMSTAAAAKAPVRNARASSVRARATSALHRELALDCAARCAGLATWRRSILLPQALPPRNGRKRGRAQAVSDPAKRRGPIVVGCGHEAGTPGPHRLVLAPEQSLPQVRVVAAPPPPQPDGQRQDDPAHTPRPHRANVPADKVPTCGGPVAVVDITGFYRSRGRLRRLRPAHAHLDDASVLRDTARLVGAWARGSASPNRTPPLPGRGGGGRPDRHDRR